MPTISAEDFFAVLEKSKLLSPQQLADARKAAPNGEDATEVARALARDGVITRWQAGQLLAGRSAFFLGKYKLIELLGRGGMGSVFLGEHVMMNRRVALKVLSKQVSKDSASLDRFLSEARAIAALDHPNIVQAYSIDTEADRYYIVMEFVDGMDLQRLVETEGPLDYGRAVDYIRQSADGLAHAHQRKMIHCDIKPSNLLVNGQGVVKILDMGLARLVGRDKREPTAQDDSVLGTVDYLAPEQAVEGPDFDHRADIYALGCTLYFLLTGHPPFPDGTLPERIMKHQTQQPPAIGEQRRDAPADLVQICERMMAKKPADRFQSADELSKALSEWRPADRKPKRAVPLKRAEAIADDEGDYAIAGEAKPAVRRVPPAKTVPPKTVADKPAGQEQATVRTKRSAKNAGLLNTPRRKMLAIGAGFVLMLALIALTVIVAINSSSSGKKDTAGDGNRSAATGERKTEADGKSEPGDKTTAEEKTDEAEKTPAKTTPEDIKTEKTDKTEDKPEPKKTEPGPEKEKPAVEEPKEIPELPKPEPKEIPAEKPKPPPKKPDPLLGLEKAVAVASLMGKAGTAGDSTEPVSLGSVAAAAAGELEVELLGGKDALKRNQKFAAVRNEEGGTAWKIQIQPADNTTANVAVVDVAKVWLDKDALKFAWNDLEQADRLRANSLRNCGLKVSAGEAIHWIALSKPQTVEPFGVDLERGGSKVTLKLDTAPEPHLLRLHVTGLEGPAPTPGFQPTNKTVEAKSKGAIDKGTVSIVLSEGMSLKIDLRVTLDATKPRTAAIDMTPYYQSPGSAVGQATWLTTPQFNTMAGNIVRMSETSSAGMKDPQKKMVDQQIQAAKKAMEQLNPLRAMCQKINKNVKIHYRVFVAADDREVELFTTKPAEAAGGKK